MTDKAGKADIILQTIESNPGIHFRELMRKTGLMNGVLSHHIVKLERNNLVIARRRPRTTRFFSARISESDHLAIRALRRPTPRALLLALLHANPDGGKSDYTFADLVKETKKSPSTVSLYLSQLVKEGIVGVRPIGLKKHYQLNDWERIGRLLEDHGPGIIGSHTSNFKEMINPLGS